MGRKIAAMIILAMLLCESAFAELFHVPVYSTLFPDDTFRKIILENYDIDGDKILSASEQKNIGTIQAEKRKISSVEGIQALRTVTGLEVGWNKIKTIDLSGNPNLNAISANNNALTAIDFSQNPKMYYVNLSNNKLKKLDFSKCPELAWLEVENNGLTSLNVTGCSHLENLLVRNNKLNTLNIAGLSEIYQLCCEGNQIKYLDISGCTELLKIIKKEIAYHDGTYVSWGAEDIVIDKGTTLTANGKTIYSPEMWPFLNGDPFALAFATAGDGMNTTIADVVVKEAVAYSDKKLKNRIGTIPAYTAVTIDIGDELYDLLKDGTIQKAFYLKASSCKVLNYGNQPCYINPSALWGKMTVSPDWYFTKMQKGTKMYQRPDVTSASIELENTTDVVIISERAGWYLIRANKGDLDPYFFVWGN